MADVTFTTETHTVVGTTSEGMKIVFTSLVADGGTTASVPVTIKPLKKIVAWTMSVKSFGADPTVLFPAVLSTTIGNLITVTPSKASAALTLEIVSVGI